MERRENEAFHRPVNGRGDRLPVPRASPGTVDSPPHRRREPEAEAVEEDNMDTSGSQKVVIYLAAGRRLEPDG
jgi:hypothetical protein